MNKQFQSNQRDQLNKKLFGAGCIGLIVRYLFFVWIDQFFHEKCSVDFPYIEFPDNSICQPAAKFKTILIRPDVFILGRTSGKGWMASALDLTQWSQLDIKIFKIILDFEGYLLN